MHCCYSILAISKDPSICFLIFKNYFYLLKSAPQPSNFGVFRNISTYAFLDLHLEGVPACDETGLQESQHIRIDLRRTTMTAGNCLHRPPAVAPRLGFKLFYPS
ncbi:hypothetical protein V6N11_060497 [Hibiscus sabdariffa]|uniref:Uncharacterized protein n=1 Tax=Hibiscus sabdariffa TaxID=183260 RepID=A0ABR2QQI3_9ROSI